ncbi:hypothetical protein PFLUV_G00089030 [Perca fluviatilis]|uniref:G patch domain-containing protein 4 n=1 Tax=Perca fluviatilis TaxID=8168 RepID=A0A6A5FC60_PERFL|nr:G patch domain-containing protein 4 [Perca fluviatilis]KAF1388325.1 hypothetical protein PFLUV_G00089030 [Perca fluviatilis]
MADAVPEKSRALKFAEQQLLRHGWEHGKGLGRSENGISEAIKVKVKCGKGGVGHKEGEQFTFHWWDHVFNKASSGLHVESDQNGIQLKKTMEQDEEDGMISNKKPRKATLAKAKLYGCFVKSATLLSGQEQPEPKSSSSDDSSSSEEEDQKLDLSSTTKLSDADLMKACGGRTAHKGARHGLTMSAKLARLEQQEAEFMAKYGKKSQPASAPTVGVTPALTPSQSTDHRAERQEETVEDSLRKNKRSTKSVHELNGDKGFESPGSDVKPKKKKKKKEKKAIEDTEEITDAVSTEGDLICVENSEADHSHKTKRKHKKKNNAEQNKEERTPSPAAEESKSPEETAELHTDKKVKKKKKKSSKHRGEPAEEEESHETSQSELVQDCVPKTKKKKAAVTLEEADFPEEEATVKQKRKKCKKDKPSVEDDTNEEALPPKKKKKKKSKE